MGISAADRKTVFRKSQTLAEPVAYRLLGPHRRWTLAGVININEIVRGRFCSGYLGYYALVPHNGRGYMKRGLRAVISEAFGKHKLHRLEANIQPDNEISRCLVQRLGFRLEGFSPRYLKIAGRWRDHERWALTAEEWKKRFNRSEE